MREHHFIAGDSIQQAVVELVAIADEQNEPVKADFNGVELVARPGSDPAALLAHYWEESARLSREYAASPEGKRASRKTENRRLDLQAEANRLMSILDDVDFTDVEPLIDWLDALQEASDHSGVYVDKAAILGKFEENGYRPDVYCGDDFDGEDREVHGRWLIGQALSTLAFLSIHQAFKTHASLWRERFASAGDAC